MGEVTPFTGNLPATMDGLQRAAAKRSSGDVSFIKMDRAGNWMYGAEDTPIEKGALWAIHPGSFHHGFICWEPDEDKPAAVLGEQMVGVDKPLPDPGQPPKAGASWDEQVSFQMACTNGDDAGLNVLYKASSVGGKNAFADIAAAIMEAAAQDPEAIIPIVKLSSSSYQHSRYGKIFNPVFEVVKFIKPSEMGAESDEVVEEKVEEKPQRRRRRRAS